MRCRYNKPSPTKGDGDDSTGKIRMTLVVPLDDLSPQTADDLFGAKSVAIEFWLREPAAFQDAELPGTEELIACGAEISGYTRKKSSWTFSFLVSQDILDLKTAFDRFWKADGSVRVLQLGELNEENEDDAE